MIKQLTKKETKYRLIKEIVESASGIKNLATRSRKRYIVDCRYVYYHLCRKHIKRCILADCSSEVDRHHAMAIHGLKVFKIIYRQSTFEAYAVYLKATEMIEDEFYLDNNVAEAAKRLEKLINRIEVDYEVV